MEAVGFGLALLGFVLCGAVWFRSNKQVEIATFRQGEVEAELQRLREVQKVAEKKAAQASDQVRQLEKKVADAIARRDQKAMAAALWNLELERSYRQWRDVIIPAGDSSTSDDVNAGQQLAFAISQEVERLREEVGVAIRFDGGIDLPLEPESALGALRISEELLALAAREADEVVVSLDQGDEPSIVVTVECQGWNGPETVGSGQLEVDLEVMATKLEGWLRWNADSEGHVSTTLRLPAPAPSA